MIGRNANCVTPVSFKDVASLETDLRNCLLKFGVYKYLSCRRQSARALYRWKFSQATKAQCTAENSTQLNWMSGSFSSVEFSSVFRCRPTLNRRRPTTAVAGSWLRTGDGRRQSCDGRRQPGSRRSSSPVFVQRQTLRWLADSQVCPDCEEPAMTAESSQVVAGSMHSGKPNWTEQFSWVRFSSVSRCANYIVE